MEEMLRFDLPDEQAPIIKVIGVGGGGSNAVTHMYKQGIKGVDFFICNTDAQALSKSVVPDKIKLGSTGLGAGSNPSVGRESAILITDEIRSILETNTSMLFITAGMGGGTGTGAAPVIAQIARELGILTVGIVTKPFAFEGRKREQQAVQGIEELKKYVDTILIICNDKLLDMQGDLKLSQAFGKADDVLTIAAKGIAEIITVTGRINVDFEDVKTVMRNSGKAIMGAGMASGPDRASKAVEMALNSPLLDDTDIKGADNVLLYITSGKNEISLEELNEITGYITSKTGDNANLVWGDGVDEKLDDEITITLIATGFSRPEIKVHQLDEKTRNTFQQPTAAQSAETITEVQLLTRSTPETLTEEPVRFMPEIKVNDVVPQVFNRTTPIINEGLADVTSPESDIFEQKVLFRPEPELEIIVPGISFEHKPPAASVPKTTTQQNQSDEVLQDRKNKLRGFSYRSPNQANIEELEKVPAYERHNIVLQDMSQVNEANISRFTLGTDDTNQTGLRENNSFLHDAVD